MTRQERIQTIVNDFEMAKKALQTSTCHDGNTDLVAAQLVVAARLEAVEDALISGLPTAGEGI